MAMTRAERWTLVVTAAAILAFTTVLAVYGVGRSRSVPEAADRTWHTDNAAVAAQLGHRPWVMWADDGGCKCDCDGEKAQ